MNKRLLTVGGTSRNVGKTEFVCALIRKFSSQYLIYALKVSAVFPHEESFHGHHENHEGNFLLVEEKNRSIPKDTSRMLRAGAHKVFYLRCDDAVLEEGYKLFLQQVSGEPLIVCESNSLHQVANPAIKIAVKSEVHSIKPRALPLLESADLVVISDGASGFSEIDKIDYQENEGWRLML